MQEFLYGENVSNVNNLNVLNDSNIFRPHSVNVETVILTIKDLKETSFVGLDGFSMRFFNDTLYVIAIYLTCIPILPLGLVPLLYLHHSALQSPHYFLSVK